MDAMEISRREKYLAEIWMKPNIVPHRVAMLSPFNAWRIVQRRTGVRCGRSTFYRWVADGKVISCRIGSRIFIPWTVLEEMIDRCRAGERIC
jgi:hypothetical protein